MLIHLVTPTHGFATFPTPATGVPRVSGTAKEFTVIQLCKPNGEAIDLDAPLRSETIVTLRDQEGRYLTPQGDQVRLAFVTHLQAKFLLRKVNGNPLDTIHHGDQVALGAFTATPLRYRWLQLDSQLKLGGLTKTYGGATQRPTLLIVDETRASGGFMISDDQSLQEASVQTAMFRVHTPLGAIQKDSFFDLRVNSVAATRYAIGNRALHPLPAGGETVELRVRQGETGASFPVKFEGLPEFHPCRLHVSSPQFPSVLQASMTFRPVSSWGGTNVVRSGSAVLDLQVEPAFDFMRIHAGGFELGGTFSWGIRRSLPGNGSNTAPFTLTVTNGSSPLGPGPWFCGLAVEPFPMPQSHFDTTASTPVPPRAPADPTLVVGPNGEFTHRFEFLEMSPLRGHHLFCCTVHIVGRGASPKRYRRRFALEIAQ